MAVIDGEEIKSYANQKLKEIGRKALTAAEIASFYYTNPYFRSGMMPIEDYYSPLEGYGNLMRTAMRNTKIYTKENQYGAGISGLPKSMQGDKGIYELQD